MAPKDLLLYWAEKNKKTTNVNYVLRFIEGGFFSSLATHVYPSLHSIFLYQRKHVVARLENEMNYLIRAAAAGAFCFRNILEAVKSVKSSLAVNRVGELFVVSLSDSPSSPFAITDRHNHDF